MKHSVIVVVLCLLTPVGCAEVLGGLAEGTSRTVDASDASRTSDASSEMAPTTGTGWLEGFQHRVAFTIESAEPSPLPEYSFMLAFQTGEIVEAGTSQKDMADLRVTKSDGVTLLPYWLASEATSAIATVWTKLDLPTGSNSLFVYYSNSKALSQSSFDAAFIDGIVANPMFDGTASWTAEQLVDGGTSLLAIADGHASVMLSRAYGDAPLSSGWCQPMTFPAGRRYRLIFDVTASQLDRSELAVWTGGLGSRLVWSDNLGAGPRRGVEVGPIDPGATVVCLGGTFLPSSLQQDLSAYFDNVRVSTFASSGPIAGPPGPEEDEPP